MRAINVLVAVLCSAFGIAVLAQGATVVQASPAHQGHFSGASALDDPWH